MIYTVTFNPSLDYVVEVDDLKMGVTNRTSYEQMMVGGKGINVSFVLNNLGFESTALGFLAGFTGDEIARRLESEGIRTSFIKLQNGMSRINMKIRNIDGMEINGMGPDISEDELQQLINIIDKLHEDDVIILAGSIPKSLPSSIYMDILEILQNKKVIPVVDATGELLMKVLEYNPFLIKPNHHELEEIFGVKINSREDVEPYARKLQEKGAMNVLVSMAGQGAVLLDAEGKVYMSEAPEGKLVNAVGAGDSMVAGFLAGWMEKKDYEYAFHMGLSAGSASAFSDKLATRAEIEKVYKDNF